MLGKRYIAIICFLILFVGIGSVHAEEMNDPNGWETRAEFSYAGTTGVIDTATALGKFSMKKDNGNTRYFLRGDIQYSDSYGGSMGKHEVLSDKWIMGAKREKMITDNLFYYSSVDYDENEFFGYAHSALVASGCGCDIVKTNKHYLKGLMGIVYSYDYLTEAENNSKEKKYGSDQIIVEYIWNATEDLVFKNNIEYLHSLENADKYFVNTDTIVEVRVSDSMSLGFGVTINYQNDLPNSKQDVSCTEKIFSTSIIFDL